MSLTTKEIDVRERAYPRDLKGVPAGTVLSMRDDLMMVCTVPSAKANKDAVPVVSLTTGNLSFIADDTNAFTIIDNVKIEGTR